ncbi:MAG: hypothetical protein ACRBCI_03100 [Cellvibrionaceae bacterium]
MNTKIIVAFVSIFLFSVTTNVVADNGIQYNYAEFRFVADAELDDVDVDGDGFAFSGSFRLDELFYLVADYEDIGFDRGVDSTVIQLGAGVIAPYEKVDIIGELAIVDADVDGPGGSESDTGFRLTGGVRGYVMPQLEVRGTLNYVDVEDDDTFVTLAADYFINDSFSVNIAKDLSAELDRLSIGVRYYFGE